MNKVLENVENEIVEFNEFESQLLEFKKRYDGVVYDLSVPEEEKQARSDRLTIGKVIANLDRKHKDLKAPLKEKVDLIDGERKRIKDDLLNVQEKIKSQIKQHEDAIRERAEKLQSMVEEIRGYAEFDPYQVLPISSDQVKERLDGVQQIIVDDSFEERKADATLAQVETIKQLESLLAERLKYEKEQEELERLRAEAAERERQEELEKIRKEAEERAKAEREKELEAEKRKVAEAEERGRQQAVEAKRAAEQAKIDKENAIKEAEERAKREAEEAEQKRLAEEDRLRAEDEKRAANKRHRTSINNVILKKLNAIGIDEKTGKSLITAIAKNEIPNLHIKY